MFLDTPPELLRPIHSLLKAPFDFDAHGSLTGPLLEHLRDRGDFDALLELAQLYDRQATLVRGSLAMLRPRLESEFALNVPVEADLSGVCRVRFSSAEPEMLGIRAGQYLRHVTVQCQLERLYDQLGLERDGDGDVLSLPDVRAAVQLMMLGEAFALCVAGVGEVKRGPRSFRIVPAGQGVRDLLRATWFARIADQGSHTATIVLANRLSKAGASTVRDVSELTERILDQDLSISWRLLGEQGRSLNAVQCAYDAAALIALLTVLALREEPLKMNGPEMARRGLDFGEVSALLRRQANTLVTDRFVVRRHGELFLRMEASSKGLRQYLGALVAEFGEQDQFRKHAGSWFFEKVRIRERIEQFPDYQDRYRILNGFTRDEVVGRPPNKCDVEFIIWDTTQSHYYFVQAKHGLLGEKAFFDAMVKAVQKDIGKGLLQLREAKRLLVDGLLEATLQARGLNGVNPSNSSFVMLHNIAQFDYQYTSDGIALYDWSGFRNLLKDGESTLAGPHSEPVTFRLPSPLVVDQPIRVIQRLLNEHPGYRSIAVDPWSNERANTTYELLGEEIRVEAFGI